MAASLLRLSAPVIAMPRTPDAPSDAPAVDSAHAAASAAADVRAVLVHRADQADLMRQRAECADDDAASAVHSPASSASATHSPLPSGPCLGVPLSVSTHGHSDADTTQTYEFRPLEQSPTTTADIGQCSCHTTCRNSPHCAAQCAAIPMPMRRTLQLRVDVFVRMRLRHATVHSSRMADGG